MKYLSLHKEELFKISGEISVKFVIQKFRFGNTNCTAGEAKLAPHQAILSSSDYRRGK